MTFFEIEKGRIERVEKISLMQAELRERQDLQALLRQQLPELIPDLLVIAEEREALVSRR